MIIVLMLIFVLDVINIAWCEYDLKKIHEERTKIESVRKECEILKQSYHEVFEKECKQWQEDIDSRYEFKSEIVKIVDNSIDRMMEWVRSYVTENKGKIK